jgi:hypothetical protein
MIRIGKRDYRECDINTDNHYTVEYKGLHISAKTVRVVHTGWTGEIFKVVGAPYVNEKNPGITGQYSTMSSAKRAVSVYLKRLAALEDAQSYPLQIETVWDLARYFERMESQSRFFSKENMRFFGDTMANFEVTKGCLNGTKVYVLSRKRATVHFNAGPGYYFDAKTLERVFE